MLRLVSAAILASIVAFVVLGGAEAKGPFRAVLSGGDLPAPITVGEGIDGRAMFGDGTQIEPPLPFPQYIYTLDLYQEGAEAGAPPDTIYYYPAHDGLPAAFRTSYGFFAVTKHFDWVLRGLLPSHQTSDSTSPVWYVVPGLALALVLVGGGFAARAGRRRATPGVA